MAMSWSPSTRSPAASTASTRSASPSKARPDVGAAGPRPRRWSASGWVDPHAVVDVDAVGLVVDDGDRGPQRAGGPRAPRRWRAPLAQSSTTVRPVEAPAADGGDQAVDVAVPRRRRRSSRPTPSPTGRGGGVARRRCRPSSRSSSASSRASTSSRQLAPAGGEELDPVVRERVVRRRDHRRRAAVGRRQPGHARRRAARRGRRRRRPRRPARRRGRPGAAGPRPGCRGRPGNGRPPSTRAAARPRARTSSGVSSALATPRTPSVPNRRVTGRTCLD